MSSKASKSHSFAEFTYIFTTEEKLLPNKDLLIEVAVRHMSNPKCHLARDITHSENLFEAKEMAKIKNYFHFKYKMFHIYFF